MCPGDELVFICATATKGSVRWRLNGNNSQAVIIAGSSPPKTFGSFLLKVTLYNNVTHEVVSTAPNDSAPVSLNGTSIDCTGGFHISLYSVPLSSIFVFILFVIIILLHMYLAFTIHIYCM